MPLNVNSKFDQKPYSNEGLNGYNWKTYLMTPRSAILRRIKKIRKTSGGIMPLNVYAKSGQKPSNHLRDRAGTDGQNVSDGRTYGRN